jgi:hypothetical protein
MQSKIANVGKLFKHKPCKPCVANSGSVSAHLVAPSAVLSHANHIVGKVLAKKGGILCGVAPAAAAAAAAACSAQRASMPLVRPQRQSLAHIMYTVNAHLVARILAAAYTAALRGHAVAMMRCACVPDRKRVRCNKH